MGGGNRYRRPLNLPKGYKEVTWNDNVTTKYREDLI